MQSKLPSCSTWASLQGICHLKENSEVELSHSQGHTNRHGIWDPTASTAYSSAGDRGLETGPAGLAGGLWVLPCVCNASACRNCCVVPWGGTEVVFWNSSGRCADRSQHVLVKGTPQALLTVTEHGFAVSMNPSPRLSPPSWKAGTWHSGHACWRARNTTTGPIGHSSAPTSWCDSTTIQHKTEQPAGCGTPSFFFLSSCSHAKKIMKKD